MWLRQKFIAVNAVIFLSVLSVVAFSAITLYRMELLRDTVDAGASLLERSRTVRSLTKDIMIGAFAPDTYADLKDVVYFEPYTAALRFWHESVRDFQNQFASFMEEPVLLDLVHRGGAPGNADGPGTAQVGQVAAQRYRRLGGLG